MQGSRIAACLGILALFCPITSTAQQAATGSSLLPQFVFGDGWYTAMYFTNLSGQSVSFPVYFYSDLGTPLIVPSLSGSSTQVTIAVNGTAMIEATNVGSLRQGYATFTLPVGVGGYGFFRASQPGGQDQEAVVPFASSSGTASTLTWDGKNLTTGVAVVNPSSSTATIAITARNEAGAVIGTSSLTLPPLNHTAADLSAFPGLSGLIGQGGSAQFTASTGNVAVLELRFRASAFTSIPPTTEATSQVPITVDLGHGVKMDFVPVNPGQFMMGCSPGDAECYPLEELPVHPVRITRGFQIGKYQVTQEQWQAVLGSSPSFFKGATLPVEMVSWDDVQGFLQQLNGRNDGYRYRMPTEAEWEYAARAGTTDKYAGASALNDVAWYSGNAGDTTHPVGQKQPNAWGLYDMLGNVWEWCQDWDGSYSSGAADDPTGPSSGQFRILRGGSWYTLSGAWYARVSVRLRNLPGFRNNYFGFRTVREQVAAGATALNTLTLSASSVVGGNPLTGTVTLTAGAPTGGTVVILASNNTNATVPASVTVSAGQTSATFTVSAGSVSSSQTATITASYGGSSIQATLTITPAPTITPHIQNLALSTSSVAGGGSVTGTATLSTAAPPGGAVVALSSSSSSASVPATVTVGAGTTSATFTVSVGAVSSSQTVTITASFGGTSAQATLTITAPFQGPVITSVENAFGGSTTIAPNTWCIVRGSTLAQTTRIWDGPDFVGNRMPSTLDGVSVTMNGQPAYLYYISPTQLNILTPPDLGLGPLQVLVTSKGAASAAFTVQAQPYSPSFFVFDASHVTGTHGDGSLLGPTSLYPGVSTPAKPNETVILYANGFGPTSSPVVGGELTQSGSLPVLPVVSIGGISATVQFAGLVSPGLFQFNVVVPAVAQSGDNILSATYKGLKTQSGVVLAVDSPPAQVTLKSLAVNPTSVTGGQSAIGTITLSGPAPTGGVDVQVSIGAQAPFAVRVAAGQTSATFTVPTSAVTSSQTLTITATYAGVALTTTLTLSPPTVTLSSLGLSSLSVTGGTSTSGVVVLSGSAPAGGVLVTLRTSGSAATVPSGVTIAAGLNAATFAVTTSAVTSTQTITITASLGSVSKTITLTVNAPPASPWALATYTLDGTLTVEGQTEHVQIGSQKPYSWSGPNDYFGTILNQEIASIKVATNIVFDKGASATGNTITYTGVDSTSSTYLNFSRGALEPVISGTMTLTLSAAKVGAAVSGTINFATTARTLTATFTGTVQSID